MDILKWLTSFDAVKGVVLAIVVIISSWYDLRAEVRENRSATESVKKELSIAIEDHKSEDKREQINQVAKDLVQDTRASEQRQEIRDAIKDLKAEIRSSRR